MTQDRPQRGRRNRGPSRLRTRLALALLAVFIPIAVLLFFSHLEDLNDRRDARIDAVDQVGSTMTAVIASFVADLETLSVSTAAGLNGRIGGETIDEASVTAYLRDVKATNTVLRQIIVTDTDGTVLATDNGVTGVANLADRLYIQALQRGAASFWSGGFPGSLSGQTIVVHSRAIRGDSGAVEGYLAIAFYPSQLLSRLSGFDSDGHLILLDNGGAVLYDSAYPSGLPAGAAPVVADRLAAMVGQGPVSIRSELTPFDDEDRYGVFAPVGRNGWIFGYTRPAEALDGPLRSRLQRDYAIVVVVLLLGCTMMLLIASRLSRPLTVLSQAAAAIARGERPVVPMAAADADVRQLELAMQSMSNSVAVREEQLKRQTRDLETLEQVGESLATELDYEKAVASISMATLALTGAVSAGIYRKEAAADGGAVHLLDVAGVEPFPIREDDPVLANVLAGQIVDLPDALVQPGAAHQRPLGEGHSARNIIGVPIIARSGDIYGGLFLIHSKPNVFDQYARRLATGLAARAGIVLENAALFSESRRIQEELKLANVAKDEFIGVMSHELRTPITTIYGGARLLQSRRGSLPPGAEEDMIASIEEEAERLYRLVENLLALARADLGEVRPMELISVAPLLDQIVKQFANRRPGRPLNVHAGPNLSLAWGESAYVQQIVQNLLTNADKYANPGLPIDVQIENGDHEVITRVQDRGPGVAPEEIGQIFESFYRSSRTARRAGGKGLGLTVCKRLVEAMSGRIWAEPREGGGLQVCFALPAADESDIGEERPATDI